MIFYLPLKHFQQKIIKIFHSFYLEGEGEKKKMKTKNILQNSPEHS